MRVRRNSFGICTAALLPVTSTAGSHEWLPCARTLRRSRSRAGPGNYDVVRDEQCVGPRTKLEIDNIEFYDIDGDLLLVSWIDRFGVKSPSTVLR